jgi:hypothetical protein
MARLVCRRLQAAGASRRAAAEGLFVRRDAARVATAIQPAVPVVDLRKDRHQVAASMDDALSE